MQFVEGLRPTPSNDNATPVALSGTIVASAVSLLASRHWAAVDLSCLAKDLAIETDAARLPLFGLGIGDDMSALARAAEYVSAFPREAAVVVSGTGSSAASSFSAALIAGFKHPLARGARGPRIIAARTIARGGVSDHLFQATDAFLLDCGLVRADIAGWIAPKDHEPSILPSLDEHRKHAPQQRGSFSVAVATRPARAAQILLLEW